MAQKSLLISSMQKLIDHVKKSQVNQQQIFSSLSRNDFKKILSNLEDDNIMLRKTSLNLIGQLLCWNSKLKSKFCRTMNINLLPGKVLLNSKIIDKYVLNSNLMTVLSQVKKAPQQDYANCLMWYINLNLNPKNKQLYEVSYIKKNQTISKMQIDIDPQQCLVGFCISDNDLNTECSMSNLSVSVTENSEISQSHCQKVNSNSHNINQSNYQRHQRQKFGNLIEAQPTKKTISSIENTKSSIKSDSQPKYQRSNNRSVQFQSTSSDRPKKFINNFLYQRKQQSFKGNQTQRVNHNKSSAGVYKRDSFQPQISKTPSHQYHNSYVANHKNPVSSQPKAMQHPYIPALDMKGNNQQVPISKTERVDSATLNRQGINRSKQLDFQKIKYQGIKVTTNNNSYQNAGTFNSFTNAVSLSNRNSHGNPVTKQSEKNLSFQNNFKYIKPMTTMHKDTLSNDQHTAVKFFTKRSDDVPVRDNKKTIDVFQYIKNR